MGNMLRFTLGLQLGQLSRNNRCGGISSYNVHSQVIFLGRVSRDGEVDLEGLKYGVKAFEENVHRLIVVNSLAMSG